MLDTSGFSFIMTLVVFAILLLIQLFVVVLLLIKAKNRPNNLQEIEYNKMIEKLAEG